MLDIDSHDFNRLTASKRRNDFCKPRWLAWREWQGASLNGPSNCEASEKIMIEEGEFDLFTRIHNDHIMINLQQREELCSGYSEGKRKSGQENHKIILDK